MEPVQPERGAPFERPVVRDEARGVVFTRIHPRKPETSMIMHVRPGWLRLRAWLTGTGEQQQQQVARPAKRFELYVCTTAEREYALEAWRLLDPDGYLIPPERRRQRIVCVPSTGRKTLRNVLALGPCIVPGACTLRAGCVGGCGVPPGGGRPCTRHLVQGPMITTCACIVPCMGVWVCGHGLFAVPWRLRLRLLVLYADARCGLPCNVYAILLGPSAPINTITTITPPT